MTTAKEATRRKGGQAAHASDLRIERRKGIVLLTLARPDRGNSLSEAMLLGNVLELGLHLRVGLVRRGALQLLGEGLHVLLCCDESLDMLLG